jgi:hypothetical protein
MITRSPPTAVDSRITSGEGPSARRVVDRMRVRAAIRCAMKRCVSGEIMRSSSATTNQVGRSFHRGRLTATVMQVGEGLLNGR